MKTTKRKATHIVAFIEILGFQEQIDSYFSGKDNKALNKLKMELTMRINN